jgi:DNA-binding XRE family transcriptional regulator
MMRTKSNPWGEAWTLDDMSRCKELRFVIEYYGMTQAGAGKLIGYSRVTINQMCNGVKKIPPAKLIELRQAAVTLSTSGWPEGLQSKRPSI